RRTYKPKMETRIRLTEKSCDEQYLRELFDELQRKAPKQLNILMKYLELSDYSSGRMQYQVSKSELLHRSSVTPAVLNALVGKGIFE
ncbi:primosomal protein N, partial [gut metagenome]